MDEDQRFAQLEAAVAKHRDAAGWIPASKMTALLADLADVVEAAYVQGLEDAQ
jgi:hypothetical protein